MTSVSEPSAAADATLARHAVEVTAVPYDSPEGQALVWALNADVAERYADVAGGAGDDPESEARWTVLVEQVTPPAGVFVVGRVRGEAAGCGALRPMLDGSPGVAEIKRMYTDPRFRRQGVSRAVLRSLEDHARGLGHRRVQLETGTRQPEALVLYESAGYHRITPYGQYRDDPLSICFAKDLAPGSTPA